MSITTSPSTIIQSPMLESRTRTSFLAVPPHTRPKETVCVGGLTQTSRTSARSTMTKSSIDMEARLESATFKLMRSGEPSQNLPSWSSP